MNLLDSKSLSSLRYDGKHVKNRTLPANEEIVFKEINPQNSDVIELDVLRLPNKEEYTRIVFYKEKGFSQGLEYASQLGTARMPADLLQLVTGEEHQWGESRSNESLISLESSHSSILPDVSVRAPETAPFYLPSGENVELRIFIDKSVIEVFANGRQVVAMRVYPGREDSVGVSIRARGSDAELVSLDAWQMKNIYEE